MDTEKQNRLRTCLSSPELDSWSEAMKLVGDVETFYLGALNDAIKYKAGWRIMLPLIGWDLDINKEPQVHIDVLMTLLIERRKWKDVVHYITEKRVKGFHLTEVIEANASFDLINTLVDFYPEDQIDNGNGYGDTALHIAVKEGRLDVVKLLLAKGADPNLIYEAESPFMYAIKGSNIPIIMMLFQAGASVVKKQPERGLVEEECRDALEFSRIYGDNRTQRAVFAVAAILLVCGAKKTGNPPRKKARKATHIAIRRLPRDLVRYMATYLL